MGSLAMITGSTAGIGKSTAILLAKQGWDLILTGRRKERLSELCLHLEKEYSIKATPLAFDLSHRKICETLFKENVDLLSGMSVLINNAGLAKGIDKMDEAHLDHWDTMVDTNVKGLLYVTRLSLPFLKNNTPSHIVNLGSVAGKWVYPGGGVYCATKFAVRALSEGLRMDLNGTNIRVTNICPGLVETEFSEVRLEDSEKAKSVYQGLKPLAPEDIAEAVVWSLSRPKHVNIQEMVIYPTAQASVSQVYRGEL